MRRLVYTNQNHTGRDLLYSLALHMLEDKNSNRDYWNQIEDSRQLYLVSTNPYLWGRCEGIQTLPPMY